MRRVWFIRGREGIGSVEGCCRKMGETEREGIRFRRVYDTVGVRCGEEEEEVENGRYKCLSFYFATMMKISRALGSLFCKYFDILSYTFIRARSIYTRPYVK